MPTVSDECESGRPVPRVPLHATANTRATSATRASPGAPPSFVIRYFLFSGISSTNMPQYPWGFALAVPFFTIWIFIVLSYAAPATVWASEMSADSKLRL